MPFASIQANTPSTSAFHPKRQRLWIVAPQFTTGPSIEYTKQAKSQPPAMFKKEPNRKNQITRASQTEMRYCNVSGPPSLYPYSRGALTTSHHCSEASGLMSGNTPRST